LFFLLNAAFLAEKQQIPILYSFVWQDRSSYPQSIALETSTLTITLPMRFPIFILFSLFFFLYLLCSWIIAIFKECLNESMNSHCLYRYQVTLIVYTLFWFRANQSLFFLLIAAFLAEKQQIPILYSFVWQDRSSYPVYIDIK
jgi:hypothetical protein